MNALLRGCTVLACLGLGLGLAWSMLELPPAPIQMPGLVASHMDQSGVDHPVTAVLLNFRGYDTLLEVAVLLLALLGMLAAGTTPLHASSFKEAPMLTALARALTPIAVLVAGYLLWAGAFKPGGAFQAAAVLAGAAVLLRIAGLLPSWTTPADGLRLALAAGLLVFLGVAASGLALGGLLAYPPEWAGTLILLIETSLTVSLALILAGLFLAGPDSRPPEEQS